MRNDGRKPFVRAKMRENIRPYDGPDAVYTFDDTDPDEVEIKIDMSEKDRESGKDYIKSFVNIIKNKVSKQTTVQEGPQTVYDEEHEADEFDHQAEAAFDYFRGITRKIENLKKTVSDAVKNTEPGSKNARLEQDFSRYMDDVNERLEEINMLLDERMQQITASTGDIKDGFSALDGTYDEITKGIQSVTKTTEENVGRINELSDTVRGVKDRVNEIHTTTNSIDKLYDSVFEFKTAISSMKTEMEAMAKKQKTTLIVMIVLLSLSIAISTAALVLSIVL